MTADTDALKGLIESLRGFSRQAILHDNPTSAITFEALKKTDLQLALRIFEEAVIAPARIILAKYPHGDASSLLDEMDGRFRQEPIANLYYDVEVLVASRMIFSMFESLSPEAERFLFQPARDQQGVLTGAGVQLADWITQDLGHMLARMTVERERRVQIMLAAIVAGKGALEEAIRTFSGYKRGAALESIWTWLGTSKLDDKQRRRLLDYLSQNASDERVDDLHIRLMGTDFLSREDVSRLVHEIMTGEHDPVF